MSEKKSRQSSDIVNSDSPENSGEDIPFSRHCVISIMANGLIQISGSAGDVTELKEWLQETGYEVKWDYGSPCG